MVSRIRRGLGASNRAGDDAGSPDGHSNSAALRAGAHAPHFHLTDRDGRLVSLPAALKTNPAVLFFLSRRSPSETMEDLRALKRYSGNILDCGATILVLSPSRLATTPTDIALPIVDDPDCEVAGAFGLCAPPLRTQSAGPAPSNASAASLQSGASKTHGPIPAAFVIDQRARIVLSIVDVAFDSEVIPANIICALQALRRHEVE